ncbi:MAG: hypothetical protein JRI45_07070 [Deltaproteobacteria bacterium]|nr:hypothetical protein [Deltaproteobacteria bacterium]MBW2067971.1 hypothetical protein [Deltaproteobacteria bacterium]
MGKIYLFLDPYLITLYRLVKDPIIGFFLGTFLLATTAVIIGQFSISLAFLVNRRYVEKLNSQLVYWNNLSVDALKKGDKETYKNANNEANQFFGKLFFLSIAYSAASLWPAPFLLGWMQMRFGLIEFPIPFPLPVIGSNVSYTAIFIPFFIIVYLTFQKLQSHLPYFRKIHAILESYENEKAKLKSLTAR